MQLLSQELLLPLQNEIAQIQWDTPLSSQQEELLRLERFARHAANVASLSKAPPSELVNDRLWRLAEEETLLLMRKYHLSAGDVVEQYTGDRPAAADLREAIHAIYRFNISEATKNGFVVW